MNHRAITPEVELARIRELKIIGIAWATACGAVEAKLLAENPHLAIKGGGK